jgi:hypothetical protein
LLRRPPPLLLQPLLRLKQQRALMLLLVEGRQLHRLLLLQRSKLHWMRQQQLQPLKSQLLPKQQ